MKFELLETINMRTVPWKEKAEEWIKKVYAKYPHTHPFNPNHHLMVFSPEEFGIFELKVSHSMKDAVEIDWVQAYPLRSGFGTKTIKELQEMAKEDGLSLTLFPWDKGRISQAKLIKFYKSLGFKPIQKGAKSMYWSPTE